VLNVPVSEIVLNEPRIRALVGQGEAASVAQHMRMGEQGREAAALYFRRARLTVDRCNGFRCSLTKNALPVGFMRARSLSHARPPAARRRAVAASSIDPPFNRATCKTRLSVSTWSSFSRQASDTRRPCRNIRSNKQRSRASFRLPLGRLDQPLDLAPGEVLPVAVIPAPVSAFAPVHHFVESFPHTMPLEPA
jgi:hypothetical protein